MNFVLASIALFGFFGTANGVQKVYTYTYKKDSNQAFSANYWQDESCLEGSSIEAFASDGFTKAKGSKKVTFKAVEGYATTYSACDSAGATRTTVSFFSETPTLKFSALNNVSIATTVDAFYATSQCAIETYVDETGFEYSYYSCAEETGFGNATVSIDLFVKTSGGVYTSVTNGVNRGPGYVVKFKSSSRCKQASSWTWDVSIGGTPLFVSNDFGYGDICKANEGYTERYVF
jgi:hypothetical protein